MEKSGQPVVGVVVPAPGISTHLDFDLRKLSIRNVRPAPKKNVDWVVVKEFQDADTGLAVQVRVLKLNRPKYSISVGSMAKNGFARYVTPEVKINNATVAVAHRGMTVARLLDEAYSFVQDAVQRAEDDYFIRKETKELDQVKRASGTNDVVKTGKTEREVGKRARHENNLVARRSADQERTSKSKNGR